MSSTAGCPRTISVTYTEGQEVEAEILRLLRDVPALESHRRIAEHAWDSWPMRYHLCPERSLLLHPFCFDGLDVLELGAGMGAMSRYLAENCHHLTAVEGTEARSAALRERLRDLGNWDAHTLNIQDFKTARRYDVVTLIGVLEYAELFISGPTPHATLLGIAASFLKPGGVLITAIENRLGLKYWNGAEEDHTGMLFDGITGYRTSKTPRTFSRRELLSLVRGGGLPEVVEYFPFPDYKIPHAVLSAALLEREAATAAAVASAFQPGAYGGVSLLLAADGLVTSSVAEAGLLAEFANSFLFFGSNTLGSPILEKLCRRSRAGELGWHFNIAARVIPTLTLFADDRQGGIAVRKSALYADPAETTFSYGGVTVTWRALGPAPLAQGPKLLQRLWHLAYHSNWDEFSELLEDFIGWSLQRWAGSARGMLQSGVLDAIASNVTCAEPAGFMPFDLEWVLEGEVPASWFILRNVLTLRRIMLRQDGSCPYGSFRDLYFRLCRLFAIAPDWRADIRREASFQAATSGGTVVWKDIHALLAALHQTFARCVMPRRAADLLSLQQRFAMLEASLAQLQSKHHETLNSQTYLRGLEVTRMLARHPRLHPLLKSIYRLIR